jgi:hypothetical protein
MFQKNKTDISLPQQSEPDSISDTHKRVEHVLTQIMETIPEQMRDHPMARMLKTFAREGLKDLRRIPPEYIEAMSINIAEAFQWVAKGKMSDLNTMPDMSAEGIADPLPDVQETTKM